MRQGLGQRFGSTEFSVQGLGREVFPVDRLLARSPRVIISGPS